MKTPATNVVDLRQPQRPRRSGKRAFGRWLRRLGLGLLILTILAGAGLAAWHFWPRPANLNDVKVIEHLVGRHYLLPTGEAPELATVTDHTKLQTPFLEKAQNGDKILIYVKASRVIIYRPSLDRIVDIGPVNIQPIAPSQAGQ